MGLSKDKVASKTLLRYRKPIDVHTKYRHRAYRLNLHSAFPFPELPPAEGKADVIIGRGSGPSFQNQASGGENCLHSDDETVLLAWPSYAAIRVRFGREIAVDAGEGSDAAWLRQCLLGPAIGVLMHQRGLLVLHASVVEIGGEAVAFVGPKGAGKSTLAAALHVRGHALVADDIAVVDMNVSRQPFVVPGPPQIKLWPDAATALKVDPATMRPLHSGIEKRIWDVETGTLRPLMPLRAMYVLNRSDGFGIERRSVREAFTDVMSHLYAPRFSGVRVITSDHLRLCSRLAETVPTGRLSYPSSLPAIERTLEEVERHVDRLFVENDTVPADSDDY